MRCISRNAPSTVLLQADFGRPHFRFPSRVHFTAVLAILSLSFRKMWPIHLQLLVVSKSSMLMCVVNFRSSLLEIFYCQNIRIMFQRHFVWKVERFIRSVYVSACANMCARVHGCLRACVRACVRARERVPGMGQLT